jgi:hypothetical protein
MRMMIARDYDVRMHRETTYDGIDCDKKVLYRRVSYLIIQTRIVAAPAWQRPSAPTPKETIPILGIDASL